MDLLWKQYEKHIDLYKFYIDAVIKINVFHYAITGGIATFYFANASLPDIRWALLLPTFLSFCLAILFGYGAAKNLVTRDDVFTLGKKLGLETVPEFIFLTVLLGIFCLAHLLTGVSLICIIWSSFS